MFATAVAVAHPACAQPTDTYADAYYAKKVSLGGRGWSSGEPVKPADGAAGPAELPFEYSLRAGLASDYMYRGTTLSARKPAVGAAAEISWRRLYVAASAASVSLPTQPALEMTYGGGFRQKVGNIDFDFSITSYRYPGEAVPSVTNGIGYWEAGVRADTRLAPSIPVAAGYAWSPNVSKTGAWSQYVAGGIGYEVPQTLLKDISVLVTGGGGYSWFGNQSEILGGYPLPAYINWQAGVTFSRKAFNLDLRYYDTNLTKENCYVFTGDPNALPGGAVNPLTNPDGLTSRWCGATFVAKFWFELN